MSYLQPRSRPTSLRMQAEAWWYPFLLAVRAVPGQHFLEVRDQNRHVAVLGRAIVGLGLDHFPVRIFQRSLEKELLNQGSLLVTHWLSPVPVSEQPSG